MRSKSVQTWMNNEMERLTMKLERYKPTGSGYNRIKPILLSKSVTHMLNNPLPVEDKIDRTNTKQANGNNRTNSTRQSRSHGILSCSYSEWEEVYPTVQFKRSSSCESQANETTQKSFTYYRNCSTRIT